MSLVLCCFSLVILNYVTKIPCLSGKLSFYFMWCSFYSGKLNIKTINMCYHRAIVSAMVYSILFLGTFTVVGEIFYHSHPLAHLFLRLCKLVSY